MDSSHISMNKTKSKKREILKELKMMLRKKKKMKRKKMIGEEPEMH